MQHSIVIGGQDRPFSVGVNQGDLFCKLRGLTLQQFADSFGKLASEEFGAQRDFLYSALRAGYEKAGLRVDFTNLQVGDWMDAPDFDYQSLVVVMDALSAQFAAKAAYQTERSAKNGEAPATEPTPARMTAEVTPTP